MNKLFAVFGNPIAHSKSPFIHAKFAESTNIDMDYQARLAELDKFPESIATFIVENGCGANVTLPFKVQALALCNACSEDAQIAGAVNVLTFKNNKIYGDNTDGRGFIRDLTHRHKIHLDQMNVLVIGAGGATRGILMPLLQQNLAMLTISNRTFEKAQAMAVEFHHPKLQAQELNAKTRVFDLIINASSASINNDLPHLPANCMDHNTIVYDLMYAKNPTPFMQYCLELDAKKAIDGLGMLVEQAAESFQVWHNIRPETEGVYQDLRALI